MAYPIYNSAIIGVTLVGKVDQQVTMTCLAYRLYLTGSQIQDGAAEATQLYFAVGKNGQFDMVTPYLACTPPQFTLSYMKLQWLIPQRYRAINGAIDLPGTGLAGIELNQSAAVITRHGDQAMKGRISNLHMPAPPATFTNAGLLTDAALTAYRNFGATTTAVVHTAADRVYNPIILNKANPDLSILITGYDVKDTLRTMRRRVVGRGI